MTKKALPGDLIQLRTDYSMQRAGLVIARHNRVWPGGYVTEKVVVLVDGRPRRVTFGADDNWWVVLAEGGAL